MILFDILFLCYVPVCWVLLYFRHFIAIVAELYIL